LTRKAKSVIIVLKFHANKSIVITKKGGCHMNRIGYSDILLEYIDKNEVEQPITTEQITKYVINKTGNDEPSTKKTVNVNMARLEKAGFIARVAKGVYARRIKTAFGYYTPSNEVLYCKHLIHDDTGIIGYETGLSILNRIGLVTQMPKRRYIATNLYTKKVPTEFQIEIKKPTMKIDEKNYRYLQLLDAIRDLSQAPVDAINPDEIIKGIANQFNLNTDRMILMARRYYDKHTLVKTIDVMLGGIE
jgi:hypothetical protein